LNKNQLTNLSKKSKRFRNPKTKLKEVGKSDKSRKKKKKVRGRGQFNKDKFNNQSKKEKDLLGINFFPHL